MTRTPACCRIRDGTAETTQPIATSQDGITLPDNRHTAFGSPPAPRPRVTVLERAYDEFRHHDLIGVRAASPGAYCALTSARPS
jgi:hypothetical protein